MGHVWNMGCDRPATTGERIAGLTCLVPFALVGQPLTYWTVVPIVMVLGFGWWVSVRLAFLGMYLAVFVFIAGLEVLRGSSASAVHALAVGCISLSITSLLSLTRVAFKRK